MISIYVMINMIHYDTYIYSGDVNDLIMVMITIKLLQHLPTSIDNLIGGKSIFFVTDEILGSRLFLRCYWYNR